MNKHTPGPWIIEKSPFEVLNVDHGMLTHEICSGYIMIAAIYVDHDSPDAHLLAAAPELLEALEWAVDNPHDDAYWISQARAAIAKAKGETK